METQKTKQEKFEKEIKKRIYDFFSQLAERYGRAFLVMDGIVLVDNKMIKISNLGEL